MRVRTLQDAYRIARERHYKVIEHVSHSRGDRLLCITRAGRPKTLVVMRSQTGTARVKQ